MKIHTLEVLDHPPLKNLKMQNLGNIVIISGANGSGKTRLKEAIVQTFQGSPQLYLKIQATRDDEKDEFEGEFIEIFKKQQNQKFKSYINNRRFEKSEYFGSLVQIDSRRSMRTANCRPVKNQVSDPDDNGTPSNFYHQNLSERWGSFMNYIHEKVAAYEKKISDAVHANPLLTCEQVLKNHPHPLEKYKNIFKQLLPEKELEDITPISAGDFRYKYREDPPLPFDSLSSGEQEIVKVVFDLARKDIQHSIIIFDEPELHLHPTLAFKLVEVLKTIGNNTNQFIFLTHSADLISTYCATGDVYFIDSVQTGVNQAHKFSELAQGHNELIRLMGENLGLFAVGKKLVFVEGEGSSIDRFTYHAIAQKYFPQAQVIPIGSVENIVTLNAIEAQIRNSIFGIDFYMIRDRDGLSDTQIEALEKNGRIRCLKKRHIENYFLDPGVLFKVAKRLCLTSVNPAITEGFIKEELKRICSEASSYNFLQNIKIFLNINSRFKIPTVKSVEKKSVADVRQEMTDGINSSLVTLSESLSQDLVDQWMENEVKKLEIYQEGEDWSNKCHGKEIFSRLCGEVLKDKDLKIRKAYIDIALEENPDIFSDIAKIFQDFNGGIRS